MISYRVYHRGCKLDRFEKPAHWPFIWDVGTCIHRFGCVFKVTKIRKISYKNQVKIYVKLER